jgi:hypothetical protein
MPFLRRERIHIKNEIHVLARNEAEILTYAFRHYQSFAGRIILHDFGSTDKTRELAYELGVFVVHEDTGDKVDDRVNKRIKETCWHGTDSDWVMVVDADELIYFPQGAEQTLESYHDQGLAVIKPQGWDMTSDPYPTTDKQIYDEIKHGAKNWLYDKPVLFSPKLVKEIEFWVGAHGLVKATLHSGLTLPNPVAYSDPKTLLLHFHHIGPVERIGERYNATRARMCENNVKMNWGNVNEGGLEHAIWQRQDIKSKLEQVIF